MRFKKIFELAINYVIHSKIRSWLTILGIIIGVSSFVAILALGDGMKQDINSRMNTMQVDIINITPGFSRATGSMPSMGGGGFPGVEEQIIPEPLKAHQKHPRLLSKIYPQLNPFQILIQ